MTGPNTGTNTSNGVLVRFGSKCHHGSFGELPTT